MVEGLLAGNKEGELASACPGREKEEDEAEEETEEERDEDEGDLVEGTRVAIFPSCL